MIWHITGDTHGRFNRFDKYQFANPENHAVIILGDAGFNFYLNKTDNKNKKVVNNYGFKVYCVRGNHEERPEKVPGIHPFYDEEVKGVVLKEVRYPNIRYFIDGNVYTIQGHTFLILGGAYSIDKDYRIENNYPWFECEQLTEKEKSRIYNEVKGKSFDFVLSHTCPISWEPTDLFLNYINQSKVDKSMELWLEEIKNIIGFKVWLFGHYHADRLERPGVEMFHLDTEELDNIIERWLSEKTIDWWLEKSPNYYMGV